MKHTLTRKISAKGNGYLLGVFFAFFLGALVVSLVFRGFHLYKNAHFKTDTIMVLIVTQDDSHIMRLDTKDKKISHLKIFDVKLDAHNLKNASINTGVPLHAGVIVKNSTDDSRDIFSLGNVLTLLLSNQTELVQINEWDMIRIAYEAKKIPLDNQTFKEIKNYVHDRSIISQIDHELYELFRDPEVINEQVSVEVVNATSVSGLASSIAKMLENGGYTVVSIRSSETENSSIQTNDTSSITAQHIQKIFSFPVKPSGKNAVADIRIVIGDDAIE